jgi:FkbM family methyltransferase
MGLSNSLYKNLLRGISITIKKTFNNPYKKVNINPFLLNFLKLLPANKTHSHNLLSHKTFFQGGLEYLKGLKEIFVDGTYDQNLPEQASVLDCGAHIGLSVIYLKSICPSAKIICFEPDETNFNNLQKNILSHKLEDIDARNEAVWIENTELSFIQQGTMSSKIGEGDVNSVKVKAVRLKDFLKKKIDFLKLDIEGAEYLVLKDIGEDLINVDKMFIEYHGGFNQNDELMEILNIITKAGFHFYIKEAFPVYERPFLYKKHIHPYDLQLNIFCFKLSSC